MTDISLIKRSSSRRDNHRTKILHNHTFKGEKASQTSNFRKPRTNSNHRIGLQENWDSHLSTMPPRPFPLALNIGTDVCHTARFKKYFIQHPTYRHSGLFRLFDKLLLPSEQKAFWKRFPLGKELEGSDEENNAGEVEGKEEVGERQIEGLVRKVAQREEQKVTTKEPAIWDIESRKACVDYIGGR